MAKEKSNQEGKPKQFPFVPIFFGFWVVVFIIAAIVSHMNFFVLFIIVLAAGISSVLLVIQLLQEWEGKVEEIKTIAETKKQGNKYVKENVTYAFVRLKGGKLKKVRSGGWKVGDKLRKVKGELTIRTL